MSVGYQVHETAIIDPGAQIGGNSRIWHWVHVCGGAIIGNNCSLGQNVMQHIEKMHTDIGSHTAGF